MIRPRARRCARSPCIPCWSSLTARDCAWPRSSASRLGDLDLNTDCIEVRDTKFFKSRRLPLSATAMAALRDYLKARAKAGAPTESDAPLFWHAKGGYGYVAAGAHLRRLIRVVGLKSAGAAPAPAFTICATPLSSIG